MITDYKLDRIRDWCRRDILVTIASEDMLELLDTLQRQAEDIVLLDEEVREQYDQICSYEKAMREADEQHRRRR